MEYCHRLFHFDWIIELIGPFLTYIIILNCFINIPLRVISVGNYKARFVQSDPLKQQHVGDNSIHVIQF